VQNDSLLVSIAGFIFAIFICSFLKFGFSFFLFCILISVILFIYKKYLAVDFTRKHLISLVSIFILGFGLGVLRYEIKDNVSLDNNLESRTGQKIIIEGIVSDEPSKKENNVQLQIDFKNLDDLNGSSTKIFGQAIVGVDFYPEFKYGDLVKVEGKLEKPQNISGVNGRNFDYTSYLEKDGIEYEMNFAKATLISSGHGNFLKSALFNIKNAFTENINKVISEPQASLLGGILLGAKSSMSKDLTNTFKIAGLSHIVALSGYNITVVAEAIMNTLSFLPRTFALSGGVLGILLFVIMSGASSTAVRAALMSLVVILAQATRRNYQIGRALLFAGLLMLIYNPMTLVFDISFQLSFLATIAIVYVAPIMEKRFDFVTEKFGLRNTIASTLSAQLLVLPLILYQMGTLSFVALPTNILILFIIPATMFFGFFTGVVGFASTILSLPLAWITWFLLTYIIKVAELFANLPFSSIVVPSFSVSLLFFLYLLVFAFVWCLKEANFDKHSLKV
jgi:competence protein ComEC